jgi:hypothetical protein
MPDWPRLVRDRLAQGGMIVDADSEPIREIAALHVATVAITSLAVGHRI